MAERKKQKHATYWDYVVHHYADCRNSADMAKRMQEEGFNDVLINADIEYDKTYPGVWQAFCDFADELYAKGVRHYGARGFVESVRHLTLEGVPFTLRGGKRINKIPNAICSYYGRKWIIFNPDRADFLRFRSPNSNGADPLRDEVVACACVFADTSRNLPSLTPEEQTKWREQLARLIAAVDVFLHGDEGDADEP